MYLLTMSAPMMSFMLTLTHKEKIKTTTMQTLACSMIFFSWMNSSIMLYECMMNDTHCQTKIWNWMKTEHMECKISLHMDLLSSSMLFMVTSMSLFVHMYSTEYMKNDPHKHRFMSYLSLFTFFMLLMMSSNNYILLLMGWEGVGICSYLLMNFWYTRMQANKSGMKAIMMNRMGDIALLMSTMMMMNKFGSTKFENLTHMINNKMQTIMNTISMLLLMGAMGKSSLMGLHVWLPDAMEGPTPMSALMHAATMVTAGIFLLMRSSSILEESKMSLTITAWMGATTAFFAATMGTSQNDMKRMMAYSTCSQLGYMALAMGISKYSISLLHLMNHAFFKSLLFLGAGITMHTIKNEQDIRKLSSLMKQTPMTYMGLMTASLTMTGTPFLTAYFSKDQMMENSYKNSMLYWLATITAALTALYSTRLMYFSFTKKPQYTHTQKPHTTSEKDILMNSMIMMLTLMSISTGYMTYTMLTQQQHPLITQKLILTPLMCSMTTSMLMTTLYTNNNLHNKTTLTTLWKNFNSNAWNFNTFYNNMIGEKMLTLAHYQTYKHSDKGILEKIINNNLTNIMMHNSQNISKFQSTKMTQHLLTMILFYSSFTMHIKSQKLNNSVLFWKNTGCSFKSCLGQTMKHNSLMPQFAKLKIVK
uniref:NADH-ubiquinone oxidoreductase chain 5 n=1 Tax=Oopsacas minuta TaxID=111878 RepID=A0A0G3ZCR2_9METZ|nr:NADH dehydrogenase subunit 5 [Oopsacas minuta]AKM54877.1 NADH dehydrogenase subunit 5 [Oopsacas minuta]